MPDYDSDELAQQLAYDEVAYESHPFSQTHPARLAAAAHLLGLHPPDVQTARVLELGCAAGGNLIPLAAYFPNAHFVGIDISGNQIEEGRQHIAALGLTNIELRRGSITEITPADGTFDYIISHGLYSWVSPEIANHVLRVSKQNLTDNGIAYVSYNVYPGWHMRKIARDLMRFHTADIASQNDKIREARGILSTVTRYATGTYGAVLESEREAVESGGDYYLRHEGLSEENNPVYFRDFSDHAGRHGLIYLSEADLPFTALQSTTPAIASQIRRIAGDDYIKIQQYMDFFLGRPFRMSLLVNSKQRRLINRHITPERVEALHFNYRNTIIQQYPQAESVADSFDSTFRLFANDDNAISVESPRLARVLELLRDGESAHPSSYSFDELLQHATAPNAPTLEDRSAVAGLVLEMIRRKMLWFTTAPLICSPVGTHPKAFPLVIDDIINGRPTTTNIQHDRINFTFPASTQFLQLLDGTRSVVELKQAVYERVVAGTMKLESALGPFDRMTDTRVAVHLYVERTLQHLAKVKLLIS
jgi:SAM-dependent methyltransferase